MYDEPYRWIEAVGNRRQYLDEQFRQGSPVVAVSYADGILLLTVSRGTPKLYEVYDRIGLAGMGHPADLEKLRFSLLETAHIEGFNRSPSDVTAGRLMKHALAPTIKQAFEEVYKAPFIVKILLADLTFRSPRNGRPQDAFLTVDYDGTFEETSDFGILAATKAARAHMSAYLTGSADLASASLERALQIAIHTWAVGSLSQASDSHEHEEPESGGHTQQADAPVTDDGQLAAHLRHELADKTIETAVLERHTPGTSKYRTLKKEELASLIPC
jgi:proteasome alpha subunit